MKCPRCGDADLMMSDRQGVEIDVCPRCRGVWLDRGELDKILERSRAYEAEAYERRSAAGDGGRAEVMETLAGPAGCDDLTRREQEYQRYRSQQYQDQYYRNRKSFWEELFD